MSEFYPSSSRVCYLPKDTDLTKRNIVVGKIRRSGEIKILGSLGVRLKQLKKSSKTKVRAKRERILLRTCLNPPSTVTFPPELPPPPPDPRCNALAHIEKARGNPQFNMRVESVGVANGNLVVTTSGAKYFLSQSKLEMWSRVDPRTNTINPRKMAELLFENSLGALGFCGQDDGVARLISDSLVFDFYADSFFIVTALSDTSYAHLNLKSNPPWNKGSGLDRMWTDGYGGSLHAKIAGNPTVVSSDANRTTFLLKSGDRIGEQAFPPKLFNHEGLYGEGARPFVDFLGSEEALLDLMSPGKMEKAAQEGFGVFMLWTFYYENGVEEPTVSLHQDIAHYPIMSYKVKPQYEALIRDFIALAHANGFKVIPYLTYPAGYRWNYPEGHPFAGRHQETEITLKWMQKFQRQYGFDGWYFDNADAGDLLADYNFIRQVRSDVGSQGIIYHHDSVDVWGRYTGLRAIMVNAYVNYTLTGETGPPAAIADPLDQYLRFFTAGYGMSQSYAAHKRTSLMLSAISEEEVCRVLAQNLHGVQRPNFEQWYTHHKPFYDRQKEQYKAGTMHRDVIWPPDLSSGWFRRPYNISIEPLSGTSVKIRWKTDLPSDSAVTYTSNEVWYVSDNGPDGPDGQAGSDQLTTDHVITLSYLIPNTLYKFKIRSSNQKPLMEEVLFGEVRSFQTGSADTDLDQLRDDWELQYFGNLSRTPVGDADGDALYEFQEHMLGTNPLLTDTDMDGIKDNVEAGQGSDPLDWNDPPRTCNNDGICQNGTTGETTQSCPNDCKPGLLASYSFKAPEPWDHSRFQFDALSRGASWINGSLYLPKSILGYVQLPSELSSVDRYLGPTGASAITAWVNPRAVDRFNLLATNVGGFGYLSVGSTNSPGALKAMVRRNNNTNSWPESNGVVAPNVWSHIAFVLRGARGYQFYINGKLDSDVFDPTIVLTQYSDEPALGRGTSISHFDGSIDEVSIWQRQLTPAEICTMAGRNWVGSACN